MKTLFLSITALSLVAGCASKPSMPDAQAEAVANGWFATQSCVSTGFMSPETAAAGQNYINQMVAQFGDTGKATSYFEFLRNTQPALSQADCNVAAMKILAVREKQVASQAQPYAPQFTTCNRAFGQVYCTTY